MRGVWISICVQGKCACMLIACARAVLMDLRVQEAQEALEH